MGLEIDFFENVIELLIEVGNGAIVHEEVVGSDDGAAFFEIFDLAMVAFADFLGVKGPLWADGDALVAQSFRSDHGDKSDLAGEFVLQDLVFGPRIDAVEDDALLTSGNEIFGLGDGLADDPIFTFFGADLFAEIAFIVGAVLDAAFFHFFIDHAAEVDLGDATLGEVINNN